MDIFASIFAGLGLFFIGIRLIGKNLKQLAGRRMRQMISRAVSSHRAAAIFGLLAGAIMQSLNAVTYVLVAMVTAGAMELRRAFPVIRWANIGTSLLVILAALNMHLLVLILIGFTGITYYLNLDQSTRYRHAIGALLGIGLLFLGIDFIKSGSAILKNAVWLKEYMAYAAHYPVLSFGIGVVVAMVVQSSSTITVVAMAMAASGLLAFDSGALVVVGAGLGSALSALTLAGKLQGSAKQLVLYQICLKGLGVAILVAAFAADWIGGEHVAARTVQALGLHAAAQLAAVYVVLQLVSDLAMRLAEAPVGRWLAKQSPPSAVETLGKPRYLQDEALAEPESALLLVDKEQQRLLGALPHYLAALRDDVAPHGYQVADLHEGDGNVMRQCDQFLTELADRNHSRAVLERTIVLRDRNDLLHALQDSLLELNTTSAGEQSLQVKSLVHSLVESLHLMLEALSDAAQSHDAEDLHMLRMLTHDRSELMNSIRRRLQGSDADIPASVQQSVFAATTLFERCVWLLRRYVLVLDATPAA